MAWLGHRGRLVPIQGMSAESVTESRVRYASRMTLEGHRFAHALPPQARQWEVVPGAMNTVTRRALEDFVRGGWGIGPWVWISDLAERGNLLTPDQALFNALPTSGAVVRTGPDVDGDGIPVPHTMTATVANSTPLSWEIDVPPVGYLQVQAHAHALLNTAPHVNVTLYDAAGYEVGSQLVLGQIGVEPHSFRASVALPASVSYCKLSVHGVFSRLWIGTGTEGTGYVPGQGCPKAIMETFARGTLLLQGCRDHISQGDAFTIKEVG